jgi:hypothetical protein
MFRSLCEFQGTPLGLTLLAGKKKAKRHHMLQYVKRVLQYVTKGKKIKNQLQNNWF